MRARIPWGIATDVCARIVVAALFGLLSANLVGQFLRTGRLTGLLLLASESLVVLLTLARHRARVIDRSVIAALTTAVSVLGPPLVRGADGRALLPDSVTVVVSTIGLLLVIGGKLTLGRRFGIAPAYRGSVSVHGPYAWIRHPIYTGYIITHAAFVVANPSMWNLCILLAADLGLVIRALREERLLVADPAYCAYRQRVSFRLIPGVF